MFGAIVSLLIFVALVVLFAWLARRAWVAKRVWLKWPGVVLAGLLAFVFALGIVFGAIGLYKLYARRSVSVPTVAVSGTSEQVARGEHIAEVLCASCHSTSGELPLSGGEASPSLAVAVHDITQGNPFFVEEMIRALRPADHAARTNGEAAIEAKDGQWRLRSGVELRVPAGLSGLLRERVTRLGPTVETVLTAAANVHLSAASPTFTVLEYDATPGQPLREELLRDGLFSPDRIVDGCLAVPEGPGLGIEVDEAVLEKYPYRQRGQTKDLPGYGTPHL